jgi:hypothetical protein
VERAKFDRLTLAAVHVRAREAEVARQTVLVATLILNGQKAADALQKLARMEQRLEQARLSYLDFGRRWYATLIFNMLIYDLMIDAGVDVRHRSPGRPPRRSTDRAGSKLRVFRKAVRIAAASASVTANMPAGCEANYGRQVGISAACVT